jgi:hypothetical protein
MTVTVIKGRRNDLTLHLTGLVQARVGSTVLLKA